MKKKKKPQIKPLPHHVLLNELFTYDPIEGTLVDAFTKEKVGWTDKRGYSHVRVKKITYKLHRIVFCMFHRRDPGKLVIDHIDGDKTNNRIYNLRAVRHKDNLTNTATRRAQGILPKVERGCGRALA